MRSLTLREAAARTSRSITTLRRYIRSGRLPAEKRAGRFGPEYFVDEEHLVEFGGEPDEDESRSEALVASGAVAGRALSVSAAKDAVPAGLFQELLMKHEQLLVQYGMMRVGGIRALEVQVELESKRRELSDCQAELSRVKERHGLEFAESRRTLRLGELEIEGLRVENAALREKIRALELITRNAVTSEAIDRQFEAVAAQRQKVERLFTGADSGSLAPSETGPRARRTESSH